MLAAIGDLSRVLPYLAPLLCGYALGSIPFGLLVTRVAGLGDIRKMGSGNIGATNVLRTGRKDLAALTLLLDGAKGAAAVLIGGQWGPDMAILAGGGALVGHILPVWLGFKGGKGVATALGVALALSWQAGLVMIAVWLAVAAITRYSSLAGIASVVAGPGVMKWLSTQQNAEFAIAIAMVVMLKHVPNMRRLMRKEEPRIGERKDSGASD
jgi:acyl phosphate:glycerol-3-phosphate acyltransferase